MPEGPEIRRAADAIAEVLVGERVSTVKFGQPKLRRYAKGLKDYRVIDVETRGKAMLTHFEHGHSIYSHNQLYGVWQVIDGHKLPKTNRSMRILLQTDLHSAILYSASDIAVLPTGELAQHPFLSKIGPDIMNPALIWRDILARLQSDTFRRKELSGLYLDQAFLAGNGNYLRSEVLHVAGIHPKRKPEQLTLRQLGALARSTLAVSRRSYETGGVTLTPRLSKGLARSGADWEHGRFYAYGREDRPCYHCGERIRRIEANTRGLYFCPQCQT